MSIPSSVNQLVAQQYEHWVYPLPIMDLSQSRAWDGGDCGRNFYTFWPDKPFRDDLDILVAGCGSNAAARYAYNHPQARVTGIDLSAASLAHEAYLKDKHQLVNLTLRQMRLEDLPGLGQEFDFIDVSGVLHHLPDPVGGLQALARVLRPEGTIAIMVYGRYGRTGVYMLQDMFRLMGLGQSADDVLTVKQTLATTPKSHPIHAYVARTRDVTYDAGLVDTFLHRQDRAYTVAECLDLVRDAGLRFMHWWDNILYYGEGQLNLGHDFYRKVNALPEPSIWQFMELFNGTLGQHAFCVCHPSRPAASYSIDFTGSAFMHYIPVARSQEVPPKAPVPAGCLAIQRAPHPAYTLSREVSQLFRQIDGQRSIRDCFECADLSVAPGAAEELCRQAFRYLWRLSAVFLRLPG